MRQELIKAPKGFEQRKEVVEQPIPITAEDVKPSASSTPESLIKDGKIAQIVKTGEADGKPIIDWVGEKHWPVFVGFPWNQVALPWPLEFIREDKPTHCKIYVRTDI